MIQNNSKILQVWDELCVIFSKAKVVDNSISLKKAKALTGFNQITLRRNLSDAWKDGEELLKDLSVEEVEWLLTLAKSNSLHANNQLKVYTYAMFTFPTLIVYITYLMVQYFGVDSPAMSGAIGGAIGLLVASLIMGPMFLGKSLMSKWRNIELVTYLDSSIVLKKEQRLNDQRIKINSIENAEKELIKEAATNELNREI